MATKREEVDQDELIEEIKDTEAYRKYLAVVTSIKGGIDIEKVLEEAKTLHAGRTSRTLHLSRNMTPRLLLEAAAKDMAYRSRLAEIYVTLSEFQAQLNRMMTAVRDHLMLKFGNDIAATTKHGRDSFFAAVMHKGSNLDSRFDEALGTLNIYIKDIDQANFHFGRFGEFVKIIYSRENNLNLDKDA